MTDQLPNNIEQSLHAQARELLIRGQRLGRFDKIRYRWFYSTYLFAPGLGGTIAAGRYELFTSIKGDTGQGYSSPMTDRETNWPQKRRVADNHNLLIETFGVEIRRPPSDTSTTGLSVYPSSVLTAGAITNPPANGKVDPRVPLHSADVVAVAGGMLLAYTYLTNTIPIGFLRNFPAPGGAAGFTSASRQYPSNATAGLSATPQGNNFRAELPIVRNACLPKFARKLNVPMMLQHSETFSMQIIVPSAITLQGVPPSLGPNGEQNDATGALEVMVKFLATESFVERS